MSACCSILAWGLNVQTMVYGLLNADFRGAQSMHWWTCCNINSYADGGSFGQYKIMQKNMKNDWNPGKWALIWEYSARAIQWIPTWQGLDDFQKSLRHCDFDKSNTIYIILCSPAFRIWLSLCWTAILSGLQARATGTILQSRTSPTDPLRRRPIPRSRSREVIGGSRRYPRKNPSTMTLQWWSMEEL